MIDNLLVGYVWQELQVMNRWFQLYLNKFETGIDDVLIPHLTEPALYMGQVLSPMGQCDQIQKIGWESRTNSEIFYILVKQKLHTFYGSVTFKSQAR